MHPSLTLGDARPRPWYIRQSADALPALPIPRSPRQPRLARAFANCTKIVQKGCTLQVAGEPFGAFDSISLSRSTKTISTWEAREAISRLDLLLKRLENAKPKTGVTEGVVTRLQ
jgi:hypothetical protein